MMQCTTKISGADYRSAGPPRGFRAHDLLRLDPVPFFSMAPSWVGAALARASWVVVRRLTADATRIPIGIRGSERTERYGDWIRDDCIQMQLSPEQLRPPNTAQRSEGDVPVLLLARALFPVFDRRKLIWGPTGSVGFEWASGVATAHSASDLDLIIRCDDRLARSVANDVLMEMTDLAREYGVSRIDANIEAPAGSISLIEYARTSGPVMVRTRTAPTLAKDPWNIEVSAD